MAITKIHPVKTSVGRAIDYVINPDKTNEYALVDTINCSAQTAEFDFKSILNKSRNVRNSNQAFHLIQSFLPGETTAEMAHRIGLELCDSILGGKYSVVIGTHVDKNHIHNHILFCAVDNIEYKKYHDCKETYRVIRKESDRLCEPHGLSVVIDEKGISKSYKEWLENKNGRSWKSKLREDINATVKASVSYDDFIFRMRESGYHIKGDALDGSDGKYISFRAPDCDRWIRGKATSSGRGLGERYTRENLLKRIEERALYRAEKIRSDSEKTAIKVVIRLDDTKFFDNPGLLKWAKKENLKRMAESYSHLKHMGYTSKEEVRERIRSLEGEIRGLEKEINENKYEMKVFAETIKYINDYKKYKPFYLQYKKSKNHEKYMQDHINEITIFQDSARILKKADIDPERFNLDLFRADYFDMKSQNEKAADSIREIKDEVGMLRNNLANLEDINESREMPVKRRSGRDTR